MENLAMSGGRLLTLNEVADLLGVSRELHVSEDPQHHALDSLEAADLELDAGAVGKGVQLLRHGDDSDCDGVAVERRADRASSDVDAGADRCARAYRRADAGAYRARVCSRRPRRCVRL